MAAYCIFQLEITDPEEFKAYQAVVPATIARYGGEYLVRGGAWQVLEGTWPERRVVVLKFPSVEQARRWYDSQDYREPKAMRLRSSRADAILVEGA
jgi:uncharacterized protein (DUF1330 family)